MKICAVYVHNRPRLIHSMNNTMGISFHSPQRTMLCRDCFLYRTVPTILWAKWRMSSNIEMKKLMKRVRSCKRNESSVFKSAMIISMSQSYQTPVTLSEPDLQHSSNLRIFSLKKLLVLRIIVPNHPLPPISLTRSSYVGLAVDK